MSPEALRKLRILMVICTFIYVALWVAILTQTGLSFLAVMCFISAVALFITYVLSVSGKNGVDKIARFCLLLVPIGFTLYYGIHGAVALDALSRYGNFCGYYSGCQLISASFIIGIITGFLALIEAIITVSQSAQV
ncbi:MAG: hypothetical protein J3R72DRAFT_469967 [Linnemannia gamsii]|nr:MAG: hypothetical protein J3R72DRAFT_469967 [Linnemannia gamsii]